MPADMTLWTGRVDPEPATQRWHQVVKPLLESEAPGVALIGFCCDEGVRRNQGRSGASEGPEAIRKALGTLAYHQSKYIYDAGDVACDAGNLEEAQGTLATKVSTTLDLGHLPVVLGGGHEMAYGSWLGLAQHLEQTAAKPHIGIINFDAHLDLRDPEFVISSGTPFAQIANACEERDWPFQYACLGASRAANTVNLFAKANELNVLCRLDSEMTMANYMTIQQELSDFIVKCDRLYVTICLDVFPAAVAPAVSAPSARGVSMEVIEALVELVRDSGKLAIADIAELNPRFDLDARTARLAARLIHTITS